MSWSENEIPVEESPENSKLSRRKSAVLVILLTSVCAQLLASCGNQPKWIVFKSGQGRFEVSFPTAPSHEVRQSNTLGGIVDVQFLISSEDTAVYTVSFQDLPQLAGSSHKGVLDGARDGAVKSCQGELLFETIISSKGYPGREFRIAMPDGHTMINRIFWVRQRLYVLTAGTRPEFANLPEIGKFMDSFVLLER